MLRLIFLSASLKSTTLSSDLLSDAQNIRWFLNMLSGDLGYMKQSVYARLQLNECTEVSHSCNMTCYNVAYCIFLSSS